MDDALGMRGGKRVGDLARPVQRHRAGPAL